MTQPAHNNSTTAIYDRSVASMVLGILAIVILGLPLLGWIFGCLCGIIAIVLAAKTLSAYKAASFACAGAIISQKTGKPVTRGFAVAGLVTGIIGVAGAVFSIVFIVLLWVFRVEESTLAVSPFARLVTEIVSMFWATRVLLFMGLHLSSATSAVIVASGGA